EADERALQVGERHPFADDEPLDLREHRRVREVEPVAPIHTSRRDQPERRLVRLHVAELHAGRARAQQRRRASAVGGAHRRLQVERVLHVARGVLRRHVERFEVVVVVLELGALGDEEAEAQEDRLDALAQQRERMAMADERRPPGQRHVDGVAGGTLRGGLRQPLVQLGTNLLFERVGFAPERGPAIGGRRRDVLEQRRQQAALARQVAILQRAQVRLADGGRRFAVELLFEGSGVHAVLELFHDKRPGDRLLTACEKTLERAYSCAAAWAFAFGRAALCSAGAGFLAVRGFASAAVFARRANEAGDDTASSARLLRSSVLPAAFSPAISWP